MTATPVSEAAARVREWLNRLTTPDNWLTPETKALAADITLVLDALAGKDEPEGGPMPPFETLCAECGREWGEHCGEICPNERTKFRPAPSAPASPKTEAEPPKCPRCKRPAALDRDGTYWCRNEHCIQADIPAAPASPEPSVTPKQLADALWQAYYHNDLDDLASDIHFHTIDGNDSPIFHETARAIIRRLVAHET